MTTFTQFSETIERLLGGARCVRITVEGYMPVSEARSSAQEAVSCRDEGRYRTPLTGTAGAESLLSVLSSSSAHLRRARAIYRVVRLGESMHVPRTVLDGDHWALQMDRPSVTGRRGADR